ncbi:NAD(P)H-dependent oxidoreductase [Candidatus Woesearchaeota archaeon]|nr:NAD(P)H-dependent oxidoreductase [Candidatus Woesearchaeota archaeon]
MKTLVVYYSRTGTTKEVAEKIANKLEADIEEIIDLKNRKGTKGYLIAGKDAMQKRLTKIKPLAKNPTDYELVIIGTPVWGWTMAPAIRTVLHENILNKKTAFFCTCSNSGINRTINAMKQMAKNAQCLAEFGLSSINIKKGYDAQLNEFISDLSDLK